jgi:succinate dehydrogenase flavin-adding protein (antitoxin of CptAB toxin-antitoxin module)
MQLEIVDKIELQYGKWRGLLEVKVIFKQEVELNMKSNGMVLKNVLGNLLNHLKDMELRFWRISERKNNWKTK